MEVVEEKKEKSVVEVELEVKQVQRGNGAKEVELSATPCSAVQALQASTMQLLCTTVGGEGLGAGAARRTGGRIVLQQRRYCALQYHWVKYHRTSGWCSTIE